MQQHRPPGPVLSSGRERALGRTRVNGMAHRRPRYCNSSLPAAGLPAERRGTSFRAGNNCGPAGQAPGLADRQRGFWRLWFVGLVVFVVRWVETVAVGVFIYQQTGSPFIVAMMTMLRLLPMGLFGAFVGAMAERMERRTTLIIVIASMVVTSLTLGILAPARARSVAPRTRKLRQRRRLGDRQPGAARDDRRGGRRDTHGHRHGGRFGV
jgi:hypothetical protein